MAVKTIARVEFDNVKTDVDRHSTLLEGNGSEGLKTTVAILCHDVKAVKTGQAAIFLAVIMDIVLRVFKVI